MAKAQKRVVVRGNVQVSRYSNGKRVKVEFQNGTVLNPEHWSAWGRSDRNMFGTATLRTEMSYKVGKKILSSYTVHNRKLNAKTVYRLVRGSEHLTDEMRML